MFKRFILSLIGVAIVTASASAQYLPAPQRQNPNNPQQYPYQGQHPAEQYYFCQTHNRHCSHAPYGVQTQQGYWHNGQYRPTNGQGSWHNGQYRPANNDQGYLHNGQYRPTNNNGQGYWHNGQYYPANNGQYNNGNSGHRSWRRGQGTNNPPPGHYYCNTHNMYCSH